MDTLATSAITTPPGQLLFPLRILCQRNYLRQGSPDILHANGPEMFPFYKGPHDDQVLSLVLSWFFSGRVTSYAYTMPQVQKELEIDCSLELEFGRRGEP